MNFKLVCIGKTKDNHFVQIIEKYQKRLRHYINFQIEIITSINKISKTQPAEQRKQEAKLLLNKNYLPSTTFLLDGKGKEFSSLSFSQLLQSKMIAGNKNIVFITGGAYGFDKKIIEKFPQTISFSRFTFSHQIIRLLFLEQLYRAFTIINNHPYHNF